MNSRFTFFSAATLSLISVGCSFLVFLLFMAFSSPDYGMAEEGYLILAFDESQNDRLIQEILSGAGMESFVSESSQKVFIDDFDAFKSIQLDSFYSEIEEFDPRNDGYAAKLKSFFVREGSRFFISPVKDIHVKGTANLKRLLDTFIKDTSYSITVLGARQTFFRYFLLLAAGCAFTLYFSRARRQFVYQLPLLVAMGWGGSSSLVLAAILCGMWELLREPLGELSVSRRFERTNYPGTGFNGIMECLKPFRLNLFLVFVFFALLIVFSVIVSLPIIVMTASCVCFFFLYFLSFRFERERVRKNLHIPFTPVLLFPVRLKTFSFFPFLLPFGILTLLALCLPKAFVSSGENTSFLDPRYYISTEEYEKHIFFQHSFSYRSLNHLHEQQSGYGPLMEESNLRYYLGEDGLIAENTNTGFPVMEDIVFPLEKLMSFLINYKTSDMRFSAVTGLEEWISVGIILAVCILDLIWPGILHKKRDLVFGDKRNRKATTRPSGQAQESLPSFKGGGGFAA
ncbi:MAG: hypothetical protein LBH42_01175 [Treponema sp.]|nr:hypothetical protein [Treponema sp.]